MASKPRSAMWIPVGLAVGVGVGIATRNLALGIDLGLAFGGLATVLANWGRR